MTTFPQSHADLLEAEAATLGTIRADGFPQLTEIWFLYDEGELKTSLNTSRLKTRNLQARPQCSLLILDIKNPYRYLEVRGRRESNRTTTTRSRGSWARSTAAPISASMTSRVRAGSS